MKKICIILLAISLSACQKSFEDCVLENMKGASSDLAAHQIRKACIEKYGEPAYVIREKIKEMPAGEADTAAAASMNISPAPQPKTNSSGDKVIGLASQLYPKETPTSASELKVDQNGNTYEVIDYEDANGNALPFKEPAKIAETPAEEE